MVAPLQLALHQPEATLRWIAEGDRPLQLDRVQFAEVWGLVGLAAVARHGLPAPVPVSHAGFEPALRFAHALGFKDVLAGRPTAGAAEPSRTVPITAFRDIEKIERLASDVSRLLVPDQALEDTRRTIYYVMVELLRNVVQHSRDKLGGVLGAQRMQAGRDGYPRDVIQVAVADAGIGIAESLVAHHVTAQDPRAALELAIRPHISGVFAEGLSGGTYNAGMGLFFIAEMTKLTAGRLLIASRGAGLHLEGSEDGGDPRRFELLATGYSGTLVAFELAYGEVQDYEALIARINERAKERSPQRTVHRWLRFEEPPGNVTRLLVKVGAEDTAAATRYSQEVLEPKIMKREPVALDFRNHQICTQSFLHALMFEVLRLAWARRVPIYVVNAEPAVRSGLDLLESYGLGG